LVEILFLITFLILVLSWFFAFFFHKAKSKCDNLQKQIEKERILFDITYNLRKTLNLEEVMNVVCRGILSLFNVQRVSIAKLNPISSVNPVVYHECKADGSIIGYSKNEYTDSVAKFWADISQGAKDKIVIENIHESDMPVFFKKYYEELGVKSILAMPIKTESVLWGGLFLFEYNNFRKWTEEEISFLKTIVGQIHIGVEQAELYTSTKKQAERESLLRKINEIVRSTLDRNEVINNLVNEAGKALNADRCFIRLYPQDNVFSIGAEYLSSSEILPVTGYIIDKEVNKFVVSTFLDNKQILVPDVELINADIYFNEAMKVFYNDLKSKSSYGFPIFYNEELMGAFVIQYVKEKVFWDDETINLAKTISDIAGTAIRQAELYFNIKERAEREALLSQIIDTVRKTLDINEIKKSVVNEIGKAFGADRCYFRRFDKKTNLFTKPDVEYLASSEIKSLMDVEPNQEELRFFFEKAITEKDLAPIIATSDLIKEKHLEKSFLQDYFEKNGIKADYAIPIWDRKDDLIFLVLHYVKNEVELSYEDKKFLTVISKQILIAIEQSYLFENMKKQAENEKLLKEILSEIKLSESIDVVYEYIIKKIAMIFNANRTFLVEVKENGAMELKVKSIYSADTGSPIIDTSEIPERCFYNMLENAYKEGVSYIENTEEYSKDDKHIQNFFNKYQIKSVLMVPLIRSNKSLRTLGAFSVCFNTIKKWTDKEINLVKSISDITVNVIWELKKRKEIEELRNVFMLVLAHDLQVPIIGERKALEYLISRPSDRPLGDYKDILRDIIKNNEILTEQLKKLLDSYSYEAETQKLNLAGVNIERIIDDVFNVLKEQADLKKIIINTQIEKNISQVLADAVEIKKVMQILLENSIDYIQSGGAIRITAYENKNEKTVITCITDNGPGISAKIKKRIFERYAVAVSTERKVGSGLGLYLAKQIINAHGGKIWFETEMTKGTSFCFSLPLFK